MEIAIPIYNDFTALDAIGPYEVLSRIPDSRVRFIGREPGLVHTDNGMLRLHADASLADVPHPDVVVVPGGVATRALMQDQTWLSWIREAHAHSTWTTSVCTGSLLLAAAGVLDGLRATSHWLELETLRAYGAEPTGERVVFQGKVVTAAGVSSGIDMALRLLARIMGDDAAKAVQLVLEYDPQPPFDAGSVDKAPAEMVEGIRMAVRAREEASRARADAASSA